MPDKYSPDATERSSKKRIQAQPDQAERLGSKREALRRAATHVVRKGDNLWDIASKNKGKGETTAQYWSKLLDKNKGTYKSGNPSLIYSGEKIALADRPGYKTSSDVYGTKPKATPGKDRVERMPAAPKAAPGKDRVERNGSRPIMPAPGKDRVERMPARPKPAPGKDRVERNGSRSIMPAPGKDRVERMGANRPKGSTSNYRAK